MYEESRILIKLAIHYDDHNEEVHSECKVCTIAMETFEKLDEFDLD